MSVRPVDNCRGMSLLELLVIIVVVSILASTAMQSMTSTLGDRRRAATAREMDALAQAIVGNPSLSAGGARTDLGYVGDIGAFPPNLNALRRNPGDWAAWRGPYLDAGLSQDSTGWLTDEWGAPYVYSRDGFIRSTGGNSIVTRIFTGRPEDYLVNTYLGYVRDADNGVPGMAYRDSVVVIMEIPDGAGGLRTRSTAPDASGLFHFDSIPVGPRTVRAVYRPAADTLIRFVTILPRHRNEPIDVYRFSDVSFSPVKSEEGAP